MAGITGKDGSVTKQISGVDTIIAGIREWKLDITYDTVDVTAFSASGTTAREFMTALKQASGTFSGNHTDTDRDLDGNTAYNLMLNVDSNTSYYGSAYITGTHPALTVDGEAVNAYDFQFTGTPYVLGANVVVDGDFTAASSAAWDVSDADVAYDTTGDQLDFTGNADVVPSTNNVITNGTQYFTQMKLENESGTTTCVLKLGTSAGTSRTTDGTYTEFITADNTTFTIDVDTDGTLSLSEIIIRPVEN